MIRAARTAFMYGDNMPEGQKDVPGKTGGGKPEKNKKKLSDELKSGADERT